ncbi:carboxylesterase/lipase family protein [Amycolatopsis sp. RTGN1]|uniref:carboxylesterase/lipase family protein n=1 Tax=Amycolatopsis ponsaeliensis TaxID=2992142 RepID=UPI002550977C|nr:carboxylesterase family protein [Amycolatopsis sp. RTGN1]
MTFTRTRARTVAAAALLAALTGAAAVVGPTAVAHTSDDVVTVSTGAVRGTVNGGHRTFLDIPYGASTIGSNRWAAPVRPPSWTGIRDATKTAPTCAQIQASASTEDCLTVDVYTPPTTAGQHLPVMVWFYGGAYQVGSTSLLNPTPIVERGKAIVVEVNYRVGPLGFLALPELATGSGAVGNYGLLDQQAGLRWVRQNAAAFGGNPSNVTLFGESAGGNSVCEQLQSPGAVGLFDRAISESGACSGESGISPAPKAQAEAAAVKYAASLGCTDPATRAACMRALPTSTLLNSPLAGGYSLDVPWKPTVDGVTVPAQPEVAFRSGLFQRVPLLIGTNRDEGRLFVFLLKELPKQGPLSPADYVSFLQETFGINWTEVQEEYPLADYPTPDLAAATALGDGYFACGMSGAATAIAAKHWPPVYAYEFTQTDNPSPFSPDNPWMPMGATHGAEVGYLFDAGTLTASQQRLSNRMIDAWTTFARTGNPSTADLNWPSYTATGGRIQLLNADTTATSTSFDDDHHCRFWASRSS